MKATYINQVWNDHEYVVTGCHFVENVVVRYNDYTGEFEQAFFHLKTGETYRYTAGDRERSSNAWGHGTDVRLSRLVCERVLQECGA